MFAALSATNIRKKRQQHYRHYRYEFLKSLQRLAQLLSESAGLVLNGGAHGLEHQATMLQPVGHYAAARSCRQKVKVTGFLHALWRCYGERDRMKRLHQI
jgi:hypothetical protein